MRKFVLIVVSVFVLQLVQAQTTSDVKKKAEQGDAAAQTKLGEMYYTGQGSVLDAGAAVTWWKKAAQQGHTPAMRALGRAYYNGKATGTGVNEDFAQAWNWFTLAAHAGESSATEDAERAKGELSPQRLNGARINLAEALLKGDGVPKDVKFAVQLYEDAAEGGSRDVLLRLMDVYLSGTQMPVDLEAGARNCARMRAGSPEAQYCMARLERAKPDPDWKRVVSYYSDAAKSLANIDRRPNLELADLYAEGVHVQRNYVRAFALYVRAASLRPGQLTLFNIPPEIAEKMRLLSERMSIEDIENLAKTKETELAAVLVAERYYAADGAPKDLALTSKACALLKKHKFAEANYCYARVERASSTPDWNKVTSSYRAAVNPQKPEFWAASFPDPHAAFECAELYAEGVHVERDNVRAVLLYAVALEALKRQRAMESTQAESLYKLIVEKSGAVIARMTPSDVEIAKNAVRNANERVRLLKP